MLTQLVNYYATLKPYNVTPPEALFDHAQKQFLSVPILVNDNHEVFLFIQGELYEKEQVLGMGYNLAYTWDD